MKNEMKQLRAILILVALLVAGSANAQILSRGDVFGPGAPPPMIGIELGLGEHTQLGNLDCDCGAVFSSGTGSGLLAAALFELPLDYEWAIGVKAGIDFKNFSSSALVWDTAIVNSGTPTQTRTDTFAMNFNRIGTVKATFMTFAPYVQYQFFRMGPLVQAGLGFDFLMANSLTQDRQLLTNSVQLKDGTTVSNLTFTNGTDQEEIQSGAISEESKLRLGLLISAGYNIQVSDRSVFSPLLTYDFPLTSNTNAAGTTWKIGSLYASAVLKYKLD